MKWIDKLKPAKGAAYIKGNALPESDHETATGRALYTITAIRKAYDAGFKEGTGSQGYGVCVDGVHIPDDVVKKAVFLYMTRDFKDENKAKARLTASAPDLLNSLNSCIDVMETEGFDKEVAAARAAIAKATGEAK